VLCARCGRLLGFESWLVCDGDRFGGGSRVRCVFVSRGWMAGSGSRVARLPSEAGRSRRWLLLVLARHGLQLARRLRSAATLRTNPSLKDYRGFVQCDAGSAFRGLFNDPMAPRQEVGCWMHARRKFFKAGENGDKRADDAITRIARLYRIEGKIDALRAQWSSSSHEEMEASRSLRTDALTPLLPCKPVTA
jgi:hypothetical protein